MAATPSVAVPTDTACIPTLVPALKSWDGLFGQVCQVNIAPGVGSIADCCDAGAEVRVQDGCTQYCKVTSSSDAFRECVAGSFVSLDGGFETFCQDVNEGIGGPGPSESSSVVEITTTSETPETTGGSETGTPTEMPTTSGEETGGASPTGSPVESTSESPDGTTSETAPPAATTTGAANRMSAMSGITAAALAIGAAYFLF